MVLYWKTLVLLNESVVFWIAGGCEAHPCVHIKMAGVHTRGFRNIPIYALWFFWRFNYSQMAN